MSNSTGVGGEEKLRRDDRDRGWVKAQVFRNDSDRHCGYRRCLSKRKEVAEVMGKVIRSVEVWGLLISIRRLTDLG
jgi:hypothetical protein